jgi:hypothetical protein
MPLGQDEDSGTAATGQPAPAASMTASQRPWLTTWGEVLAELRSLGPDDFVCVDGGPDAADDPCMVAGSTDLDDEDVPPECAERGWNTSLIKDDILGVIDNLTRQLGKAPDVPLTLRAISHYVDSDAYLSVT